MKRYCAIVALLPVLVSALNAQVTVTGNLTATSGQNTLSAYNLNNVIVLDGAKYPLTGAGIRQALSDCGANSSCNTVDARQVSSISDSTTWTIPGTVRLILGRATYTLSGSPGIQAPINTYNAACAIEGQQATGDEGTGSGTLSDTNSTVITYTGAGTLFDQTFTNSSFQNSRGCTLRNLTLNGVGAGASAIGIQFQGTEYETLDQVTVANFSGASGACVKIYNNTSGMFTERWYFPLLTLANCKTGLNFATGAGNASEAHGYGNIWLSEYTGQTGISLTGGVAIPNSTLIVNGDYEGSSCNGVSVDATSSTGGGTTVLLWYPEKVSGSCTRFNVTAGGTFDVSGAFTNTGTQPDSGTVTLEGNNAGAWYFTASAKTPSLTITNGGSENVASGASLQLSATNLIINTAPTISSGFGTSPSIQNNNGSAAFTIKVGTGGTATTGVIGLPAAQNGWSCQVSDRNTSIVTRETGTTTTSVTLTGASAWGASDILQLNCLAF